MTQDKAAVEFSKYAQQTRRLPLMPEVALITTLALIAAPIALVAGALALAAKKRLSERSRE